MIHRLLGVASKVKDFGVIEAECNCFYDAFSGTGLFLEKTDTITCPNCGRIYQQENGKWRLIENRDYHKLLFGS
ncbi:MAG: hypothetical protein D6767_10635 [Candidatus Hydrogenedentota bacterium]|nr:MAG: hypothetical protein D6767_10635 [Candidatus Hydrogenedentota bacterium]